MAKSNNGGRTLKPARLTGISIPLGAVYSKKNTVIGEFTVLPYLADLCKKSGIGLIQLLPVNDTGTQSSPYSGLSAFALHPIYIDISQLPEFENLYKSDKKFAKNYDKFLKDFEYNPKTRYDYDGILNAKDFLLRELYNSTEISQNLVPSEELSKWIKKNPWIVNYAVYKNLKYKHMQASWKEWPKEDQNLSEKQIKSRWNEKSSQKENLFYAWTQMRADEQFKKASDKVRKQGILIKGDMPILMNEDSCDAWALPGVFNQNLRAGSPVDGENPTGQNWGFPTYNWKYLKENNYSWWVDRLQTASKYYDAYRLDHILGFFRIWAIPTRDTTAVLGHTEPYVSIHRTQLHNIGFDDSKIRWLSQPHIPTGLIEDITWNHDAAVKILEKFAERIGSEELWLFKDSVSGDKDFYESDLSSLCAKEAEPRIKDALSKIWKDRALISLTPDTFVPLWTYYETTSWKSLNDNEKNQLKGLIDWAENEQNKLWETQSDEILSTLTNSVNMIPCGEDLGANLPCLPSVMQKNGILALRVLRWCRNWNNEPVKPYVPMNQLTELSVATSSVHDSPTLRQWWNQDKEAVSLIVKTYPESFGAEGWDSQKIEKIANEPFNQEKAFQYLVLASKANSVWCIHPMQDFLSTEQKYWLSNPDEERINIPGTVSKFNWTYRLPAFIEEIAKDENLINKIKTITSAHK